MCIGAFADLEPKNTILHKTNTRTNSREQKKPLHQSFVYLRICLQAEEITALFNVLTSTNKKTILAELRQILTKAQEMAQDIDATDFFWDGNVLPLHSSLPALELRLMNPKTPGQDTSQYQKLSWRAQANRKVYHVECNRRYAMDIKRLMQFAKDNKLVAEMWGKHAQVSEVVDKDLTPSNIKRLARVTQIHCNYQCSMSLKDVIGVTD